MLYVFKTCNGSNKDIFYVKGEDSTATTCFKKFYLDCKNLDN